SAEAPWSLFAVAFQRPDPDVAVTGRVAVVLQFDWAFGTVRGVFSEDLVTGLAQNLNVVLHQDAIVKDRDVGRRFQFALLEAWSDEDRVIALPFARRTRRVDQRGVLTVDGGATAVGIGPVLVTVEHLQFVFSEQKNSTVAPLLTVAFGRRGRGKFEVQLDVGKLVLREDVATFRFAYDYALLNVPTRRFALRGAPLG